jgi:hypothetical protein
MPERTCIGCRKVFDKERLVRLAVGGHAELVVDKRKTVVGRGGYLCKQRECFDKLLRKGRGGLAGGFRCRVEIGDRERLWRDILEITDDKPSMLMKE